MKHFGLPLLSAIILISLLSACKTSGVITSSNNLKPRSAKEIIGKVNDRLVDILWFDARASVSIQIEGETRKFSSQIRIKRDSLFLANGKKLSQEGGRIQISRDSFYLVNRIHDTYEIRSFDHVTDAYAIPLDFDQLMNMLLGAPIDPLDHELYESSIVDGYYKLQGRYDDLNLDYTISGKTYDIVAIKIKDQVTRQSSDVRLSRYQDFGENRLAGLRTFTFDNGNGQIVTMKVDFSKIEINVPKTFKFSIPSGYTKLD